MNNSLIKYDKSLIHINQIIQSNIYNFTTFCKTILSFSNTIQNDDTVYIKVNYNDIVQELPFYSFFSSISDKKELYFLFFDSFIQTLDNLYIFHRNSMFFLAFNHDNLLFSKQFNKPYFFHFHNCFSLTSFEDFEKQLFSFVKHKDFDDLPLDLQIFKYFLETTHYNYSHDDIVPSNPLQHIFKYNTFFIQLFGKKSFYKHTDEYIQKYYHNKTFHEVLTHLYKARFTISTQGVILVYAQLFWKIITVQHSKLLFFQDIMTFFSKSLIHFNNPYNTNISLLTSFLHNKFYHIKNPNELSRFIQNIQLLS